MSINTVEDDSLTIDTHNTIYDFKFSHTDLLADAFY